MALCHRSRFCSSVRGGSFSTGGTLSTSSGKNAYTRVLRLPTRRRALIHPWDAMHSAMRLAFVVVCWAAGMSSSQ